MAGSCCSTHSTAPVPPISCPFLPLYHSFHVLTCFFFAIFLFLVICLPFCSHRMPFVSPNICHPHASVCQCLDNVQSYVIFFSSSRRTPLLIAKSTGFLSSLILLLAGDINLNPGPTTTSTLTKSTTIQFASLNVCSISSVTDSLDKPTLLTEFIADENIEIFALSETWLSPDTLPSTLNSFTPSNYSLIHSPRPDGYGGVAYIFRSYLKATKVTLPTVTAFEALCIKCIIASKSYIFLQIYRPPSSSMPVFRTEFSTIMAKLILLQSELIITGDFNIHVDNPSDHAASTFLSLLDSYHLNQHVTFATTRYGHTLDLLITRSNSEIITSVEYTIPFISDHYTIHATLTVPMSARAPVVSKQIRALRSVDTTAFSHDILNSDLFSSTPTTLDTYLNLFNSTLSNLIDKHAPLKTVTCSSTKQKPFITPEIRAEKSIRSKLETIFRRTRLPSDLFNFKNQAHKLSKLITTARRSYFRSLISLNSNHPRKLWSAINSLLSRTIPTALPSTTSFSDLASKFLMFFDDKISKLCASFTDKSDFSHTKPPIPPPSLNNFSLASTEEVKEAILASSDSTCSLDIIPTSLLKSCLDALLTPITTLINLSLTEGSFPASFKHAIVKPLLKKYNLPLDDLSSYRPISNLNFISKILERIIHSRLSSHLSTFPSLAAFQSAYRPFHSTETALLRIQNDLLLAMNEQKVSALVLLDLSAAFDTIDHEILLSRLTSYFGITGSALTLIASYLSNRSQSVSVNSHDSSSSPIITGVPQGSVLGPLLFSLYTSPMSNLFNESSVSYHFYADDTQLYISFNASDSATNLPIISTLLDSVHAWLTSNRLTVNPSKTEYLLIGTRQQRSKVTSSSISFQSNNILPSASCRNLGVIFDSELSLKKHISTVCQTSYFQLRQLRQIRSVLDIKSAKLLANSLVSSRLDYCNSLYYGLPHCSLNRLQLVQNSLARLVLPSTKRYDHITPVLKKLHWLPISQRITYKIATITFKTLQNKQPSYLYSLLHWHTPSRFLRSKGQYLLEKPTIPHENGRRSFFYVAPSIWNSLSFTLRSSQTLQQFRSALKTYLFPKPKTPP